MNTIKAIFRGLSFSLGWAIAGVAIALAAILLIPLSIWMELTELKNTRKIKEI